MEAWRRLQRGFTLIELMVVVAIVAILASIALPNYTKLTMRAKRAELPMNLEAIRNAEKAYEHEWDAFTSCGIAPATMPLVSQVHFGHTYGDGSAWDMLGWVSDGTVRGQYQVSAVNTSNDISENFSAIAIGDIDGDGVTTSFVADRVIKPTMLTENSVY